MSSDWGAVVASLEKAACRDERALGPTSEEIDAALDGAPWYVAVAPHAVIPMNSAVTAQGWWGFGRKRCKLQPDYPRVC